MTGGVSTHFVHDVTKGIDVELTIDGRRIVRINPAVEGNAGDRRLCVAPAFWDIQTNGRWGISFSDPKITPDQVAEIVKVQSELGAARLCPTLITAPYESMRQGVAAIAAAVAQDEAVKRMILGIHLEGPSISDLDGYRGAHPKDAVRGPDFDEFQRLQEAADGLVTLITLAPERPGAIAFIKQALGTGVAIAIGHTAADSETIRAAVDAGASLSTHLGNGIASPLPRHPNPIWTQAAEDRLLASLIADGHHLDRSVLRVILRAKTPERCVLISDASPLAGLPPGVYGPWEVSESGKIVIAGTPYLAGSNRDLPEAINELKQAEPDLSAWRILAMASANASVAVGCMMPRIDVGWLANLVFFHWDDAGFELVETRVDGRLVPRGHGLRPSTKE